MDASGPRITVYKTLIRPIKNADYGSGRDSAVLTSSHMTLMLLVHRPLTE